MFFLFAEVEAIVRENREFTFTKLFTCGMCESGIMAQEKYKEIKDSTTAKYVLREGTPLAKRGLLGHLRSRLILEEKKITLVA